MCKKKRKKRRREKNIATQHLVSRVFFLSVLQEKESSLSSFLVKCQDDNLQYSCPGWRVIEEEKLGFLSQQTSCTRCMDCTKSVIFDSHPHVFVLVSFFLFTWSSDIKCQDHTENWCSISNADRFTCRYSEPRSYQLRAVSKGYKFAVAFQHSFLGAETLRTAGSQNDFTADQCVIRCLNQSLIAKKQHCKHYGVAQAPEGHPTFIPSIGVVHVDTRHQPSWYSLVRFLLFDSRRGKMTFRQHQCCVTPSTPPLVWHWCLRVKQRQKLAKTFIECPTEAISLAQNNSCKKHSIWIRSWDKKLVFIFWSNSTHKCHSYGPKQ